MRKRTIASTSRFYIVFVTFLSRDLYKIGFRVISDIYRYFFFLQFQTRRRPRLRPVVNVDHPLDNEIPFCPDDIGKYLSFIPLWIKSLAYFRKTRGRDVNPQTREYLAGVAMLYRQAGSIYDKCQSTTSRPGPRLHPLFLQIHILDPHLHCVPSLHVAVVIYNYLKMRTLLTLQPFFDEATDREQIEYSRREAGLIIDTILTVKQHSINCVAAGLYYVHVFYPEFTREECEGVIDVLLESRSAEIPRLPEVRAHVKELFNWFLRKHDNRDDPDARAVILEFLEAYKEQKIFPRGTADERS